MRRAVPLAIAVMGLDLVLFSTLLNADAARGASAGLVIAYAGLGAAVLCWQRQRVVAGYVALWLHSVASVALAGYRPTLALLVGLYVVAAHASGRAALGALLASVAPIGLAVADGVREAPPGEGLATLTGISTLLALVHCGAYGIGWWARRVRARAHVLERDREAATRDAVEVERARIAHELHDIVGHSVTVMTLQAAGARKLMRHDPNRADEALAQVGGAGAQAMSELRLLLGNLRPDETEGPHCLDELVESIRATGVAVSVCERRMPTPEPDLVVYRIVQEALTNVVRHAGPGAHASVVLDGGPDHVTIEVTDDGRGRPTVAATDVTTGRGLLGLSERASALGGRLESGPTPEGGFRVYARLPIGRDVVARPAG